MSTTVKCPQCSAPLELPDVVPAGKRLQCPDCGTAFAPPGEADAELAMTTGPGRGEGGAAVGTLKALAGGNDVGKFQRGAALGAFDGGGHGFFLASADEHDRCCDEE